MESSFKGKSKSIVVGLLCSVALLGVLSFLNACGGGSGVPASPAPQSKPSTPQTQPVVPPQTQPVMPPQTQPVTPPQTQPVTPPTVQPPGASTGTEIAFTLKDGEFPKEISVEAGAKVVFVITNVSQYLHSFEVADFKLYQEIKPGETVRREWIVPDKKGKWDMGCFLTEPGGVHEGMIGTLIIQ